MCTLKHILCTEKWNLGHFYHEFAEKSQHLNKYEIFIWHWEIVHILWNVLFDTGPGEQGKLDIGGNAQRDNDQKVKWKIHISATPF